MSTQTKPQEIFTSPVGRMVSGSLYEGDDRDERGQPYVYKTGNNIGKPYRKYSFGIAIAKGAEAQQPYGSNNWMCTDWGQKILAMGTAMRADAAQLGDAFSWKVKDGDSTKLNSKGRAPAQNEGWPGHWVVFITSNQLLEATAACQLYTLVNEPQPKPLAQAGTIMPGDFVQVNMVVEPNGEAQKPGVYINARMVCLIGYHPNGRITWGPDVASAGFASVSRHRCERVRMNRLPRAIAGLDIATSSSELVATTSKPFAASSTKVSPLSLSANTLPL